MPRNILSHKAQTRDIGRRKAVLVALSLAVVLAVGLTPVLPAIAEDESGTSIEAVQKVFIPQINKQPVPCFSTYEPSVFGVQQYGNTGSTGNQFEPLLSTGADWVRVPIYWSSVEPVNTSPENYRWGGADAAVAAAADACLRVIVTHRQAPGWAAENPESVINAAHEADFVEYIGALAERYDGDGMDDAPNSAVVLYWELYNEPDATDEFHGYEGWGNHPAEYARMLAKAYNAIKAANPQAKVLFGGLAYDWFTEDNGLFVRSFVDRVLAIDKGKHFDIFNFHSYPAFAVEWLMAKDDRCNSAGDDACKGPGLYEKYKYVEEDILRKHGINGKPIMVTESGHHSNAEPTHPSSHEIQSRYVTEQFVQSMAAGADSMIFFALVDPQTPFENGLYTNPRDATQQPKAKLALTAYKTAVKWLSDATFVRRLPHDELEGDKMDAYQFRDAAGQTFYVAWLNPARMGEDLDGNGHPEVADEVQSLRLPYSHAIVYDNRDAYVTTINDTDGDIRVEIGGRPLFIKIVN